VRATIPCWDLSLSRKDEVAKSEDDWIPCPDVVRYPYNFSTLKEGCVDPVLGKRVKWLIDSDDDYVVYVDEDFYVEWTMNRNDMLHGGGDILTRVGWLEAVDDSHLNPEQRETYKRLIGEAVARLFDKDLRAAQTAIDTAERWITARTAQRSRIWYLAGAAIPTAVALAGLIGLGTVLGFDEILNSRLIVVLGSTFGCLGAWLSVLQRSGAAKLDLTAPTGVYVVEGLVRVLTGGVGGLFVALLMRSGYLFKASLTDSHAFFAAVCLVAGLSERLVSGLAGAVESGASLRATTGRAKEVDGTPLHRAPANDPQQVETQREQD
jgi:hypothetical protein